MFIRIITHVYLEVKDENEAEEACYALNALDNIMRTNNFPHGEVIDADVDHFEKLTKSEIADRGYDE